MAKRNINFLDLPLEVIQIILAEAIQARTIKRAIRLRLVNHLFAAQVPRVIKYFRLLDTCHQPIHSLGSLGADYMIHRLLHTSHPVSPRWNNVRRLARRLSEEDDLAVRAETYRSYVELLCHRAASHYGIFTMAYICMRPTNQVDSYVEEFCYPYDLMAAAAYTNKLRIIEELGKEERLTRVEAGTFGSPYAMAAIGERFEALELLFEKQSTHGQGSNDSTRGLLMSRISAHCSLAMAREFLPRRWEPWYLAQLGSTKYSMEVFTAAMGTPHVELFEELMRIKKPDETQLAKLLVLASRNGWEDMMQHLIALGAPVDRHLRSNDSPLEEACKSGRESVVQLLLEHGATVEDAMVGIAARKGRWGIVRILLDVGADINRGDPAPIVSAIASERKDMFYELLGRGAMLEGSAAVRAVGIARSHGLESMLLLLHQHGVHVTVPAALH